MFVPRSMAILLARRTSIAAITTITVCRPYIGKIAIKTPIAVPRAISGGVLLSLRSLTRNFLNFHFKLLAFFSKGMFFHSQSIGKCAKTGNFNRDPQVVTSNPNLKFFRFAGKMIRLKSPGRDLNIFNLV